MLGRFGPSIPQCFSTLPLLCLLHSATLLTRLLLHDAVFGLGWNTVWLPFEGTVVLLLGIIFAFNSLVRAILLALLRVLGVILLLWLFALSLEGLALRLVSHLGSFVLALGPILGAALLTLLTILREGCLLAIALGFLGWCLLAVPLGFLGRYLLAIASLLGAVLLLTAVLRHIACSGGR